MQWISINKKDHMIHKLWPKVTYVYTECKMHPDILWIHILKKKSYNHIFPCSSFGFDYSIRLPWQQFDKPMCIFHQQLQSFCHQELVFMIGVLDSVCVCRIFSVSLTVSCHYLKLLKCSFSISFVCPCMYRSIHIVNIEIQHILIVTAVNPNWIKHLQ